jgi:hypothetical protein
MGQAEQGCQDRIAGIRQQGKEMKERIARKGLADYVTRN